MPVRHEKTILSNGNEPSNVAMPSMKCLHKQEEIFHYVESAFRMEDRERMLADQNSQRKHLGNFGEYSLSL